LFKTTFENTKLESETFDIVYSHYGIYHAKRIHPVFREVSRILKPRGRFVFVVPHPVRQLLEKGDTDYYKNTEYELRFGYEKTVTAVGVAHTMQEYLSEYLLDNFELTAFLEQRDAEAYYMNKDWIYPLYLAVRVQKK
jgi:SAM-dependent methyltransferase